MPRTVHSERHGFVCLLIAKNASSTLRAELGAERFASRERLYERLPREVRDEAFVFAFVRHPLPRFLSAYQEISMRLEGAGPASGGGWRAMPEGIPRLEGFVTEAERSLEESHLRRQSDYLRGIRLDFVGRVESLQEDLGRVYERLGLGALAPLPQRRSRADRAARWGYSSHWHRPEDLPPDLVRRIESLYRGDLGLWQRVGAAVDGAPPTGSRANGRRRPWRPPSVGRASADDGRGDS